MRQSGLSNNSMALSKGILKKAPTNGSLAKNCNNKLFIKRWYRKKTS
jgi:hypothetical protein